MASPSTDDFLAALTKSGLLTQPQLGDLTKWARATAADPSALARELGRRGWLTGYQVKEVYRGRAADLVVGPYVLTDLIGEGGMGRVFKARHTRLGRDVALKVIRKEKLANPQTSSRFAQEMRAVAHLSHPNVVLAFDADEVGGSHFLAMEFVDGIDLTKMVRARGALPVPEACDYVRQAALGLHHAFERGMVHRDVKPSNLIATKAGQVKVLDLGLALLNDAPGAAENRLTQEGFVIGTPDFLAPEQAKNPQDVDIRADIYALGATLFYLLTGRVSYAGANATEKLIKHVADPPPSLLAHRPDAPPQLDAIVRWMMAKKPEERPQVPAQAAAALQPFCPPTSGATPVAPPAFAYPPPGLPPPPPPPDEQRSAILFGLPTGEAPARVREPDRGGVSARGLMVATVAVFALGVAGYLVYSAAVAPPPPPEGSFALDRLGLKMVRVEGGSFVMGSPEDEPGRGPDEGPAGEVTVAGPFFVSATEVTNGQFTQVVGRSPAVLAVRASAKVAVELPVDSATWEEANEFCRKLTELDRNRRKGWGYRLPTEAEWEYACRAGSEGPFAVGGKLSPGKQAAYTPAEDDPFADGDPGKPPSMPQRVGQTEPNKFGLYDLHGNVWEWCGDWYSRAGYPAGPRANPKGPESGDLRVARGGAFNEPGPRCRSAARRGLPPDKREPNVGFRVLFAAAGG